MTRQLQSGKQEAGEQIPDVALRGTSCTLGEREGKYEGALPLIKTIQANAKTIWQTLASIPPTVKEGKYEMESYLVEN
ncbi:unnamed protein product [Caretta caretta]